jgi:hypothetical protein
MKPPQDAERIIFDVSSRVEVDRDRLRELVAIASFRARTGTT